MNKEICDQPIRLAVPVIKDAGLDSVVSAHFGRAPGFMSLMSNGTEAIYLESRSCREASECAPVSALAKVGTEVVFARSMGRGALNRCYQAGIKIYQTQARSLRELLKELNDGSCIDFPDTALCSHGSGNHEHDHSEEGEQ